MTMLYDSSDIMIRQTKPMTERYERHRQAWTNEEIAKLRMLVTKGMSLKAIAKALTRSEESTKNRAKQDKLKIQKMR
jgi:DNA-binding NarL/FixJ family response regulator